MPTKLFVSYSREDKAIARKVADALTLHGYDVFWDVKIPAGERFDTYLFGKLNESDVVVVLWSEKSVVSDYVKEEAEYGKNKSALLPLRIDDTDLPFGFTRIQTTDISKWCRSVRAPEWQLVADSIEATLNAADSERHSAPELAVSTRAGSGRKLRRNLVRLLTFGLIVAVLGGVFVFGRYLRTDEVVSAAENPVVEPENEDPTETKPESGASPTEETSVAATPKAGSTERVAEVAPKPVSTPKVARRPADLTVVVYPWGEVWINGKPKGSAPLRNLSLKPGRYKIGAGRGEASKTRTIRLAPGEEKTVLIDLTK